jgi:hypothetical protein
MLVSGCGGSSDSGQSNPPGPIDGGGPVIVETAPLNIDQDNYDAVVSYAYSIPESMLEIGQLVAELAEDFSTLQEGSVAEVCQNGGSQSFIFSDNDNDNTFSQQDRMQIDFSNCSDETLDSVIDGRIDIILQQKSDDITHYLSSVDIAVIDGDVSFDFSSALNVTVSQTGQTLALRVYDDNGPTLLSILGFEETIESFSVLKTIEAQFNQYEIGFQFDMSSEVLDGRFFCATSVEMKGAVYALPGSYSIDCQGENDFTITAEQTTSVFDAFVNVPFTDGHRENIYFSQNNYIEGSLMSLINLGSNVNLDFAFADEVEQITFDDIGQVSQIVVDKNNHIAYVAGMVFGGDYEGKLYKVNLSDMSVAETIALAGRVHRMDMSDDGQLLYIIELEAGAGRVNSNVAIYDTATLALQTNVDIVADLLAETIFINPDYIDIKSLPGGDGRWVIQIENDGIFEVVMAVYSGGELLENSVITRPTSASVSYSSFYVENQHSLIVMDTQAFSREVTLSRVEITDNGLTQTLQSTFSYQNDLSGLNDSEYYQIQFNHDGKLYIDNGFVVNAEDLSLSHHLPLGRPALSTELGRVYDLKSRTGQIDAFSLATGSQLFSSEHFENPFSRRAYTIVNGGPGYVVLASEDFLLRVGKTLLP